MGEPKVVEATDDKDCEVVARPQVGYGSGTWATRQRWQRWASDGSGGNTTSVTSWLWVGDGSCTRATGWRQQQEAGHGTARVGGG
uniref:Uncharacterized protein n=1 Tax=Oryza sativa subsp. japonica TaxID=39947 RepID=Q6YTA4_ORYSJ|nr:hypothetical protein [Oryza sativa Japonica Group]BAC99953.1 hypothetical protein [Oryza sativa Japonica Group]